MHSALPCTVSFFFNDTATTEIYTLSLHDALPICCCRLLLPYPVFADLVEQRPWAQLQQLGGSGAVSCRPLQRLRSEEHTSELQSQSNLVCRLLLEKKQQSPVRHPTGLRLSPNRLL